MRYKPLHAPYRLLRQQILLYPTQPVDQPRDILNENIITSNHHLLLGLFGRRDHGMGCLALGGAGLFLIGILNLSKWLV